MAREDGVQGAGGGYRHDDAERHACACACGGGAYRQIAPSDRHASYRQPSPTRGELRQLLDFMTLSKLPQDRTRGPRRNMSSPSRLSSSATPIGRC